MERPVHENLHSVGLCDLDVVGNVGRRDTVVSYTAGYEVAQGLGSIGRVQAEFVQLIQ